MIITHYEIVVIHIKIYEPIDFVFVKQQRSSISEKKSIVLSFAVTMSMEWLFIMILICCLQRWFRRRNGLMHLVIPENDAISYDNMVKILL